MTGIEVIFFDIGQTLAIPHLNAEGRLASLEPLPGVLDVLGSLRDLDFRLGIISNTGEETADTMRHVLTDAGLYSFFDPEPALLIYSSEVHLTKDSPKIFRLALKRAGLEVQSERCLFVGESEAERTFAAKAGLRVAASPDEVAQQLSQH